MSQVGTRATFEAFAKQALAASSPRAAAAVTRTFMAVMRGHDPRAELWLSLAVPPDQRRLRLVVEGHVYVYPPVTDPEAL